MIKRKGLAYYQVKRRVGTRAFTLVARGIEECEVTTNRSVELAYSKNATQGIRLDAGFIFNPPLSGTELYARSLGGWATVVALVGARSGYRVKAVKPTSRDRWISNGATPLDRLYRAAAFEDDVNASIEAVAR